MKALITGASSGIGRDMAKILSGMGYDLIITARQEDKLLELKKSLKTNVEVITCDLSQQKSCFELYEKTKNDNIDILINNAGYGIYGKFDETSLDEELNLIDLNIKAVHILTKLFLKDFKAKNKGYILNVASSAGIIAGGPKMSAYYASKGYVVKLSEAIYEELKRDKSNVSISILCPGPINTNFNNRAGVNFAVKSLSSYEVAKYTINKMFNRKLLIIPGAEMKLAAFFKRFLSEKFLTKVTYNIQSNKK